MSNAEQSYYFFLENVIKPNTDQINFIFQRRKPKLSDIELISLVFFAETKSLDSECQLFREIKGWEIASKIERSVYNRRKRRLFPFIEEIRKKIAEKLTEYENYYLVDSMPLEVCKIARANRRKVCCDTDYALPDFGYCACQKMRFYGYKLHAVCSIEGVFTSFDLSPASVHEIHYLKDIKQQLSDCVILGDKGYLSESIQMDLFNQVNIRLETPKRINQKDYQPQYPLFRKCRKRIETLFSQLCDQFMIRRNYAKSFHGFRTRILAKITALTGMQYLNKFVLNRNINHLKANLI